MEIKGPKFISSKGPEFISHRKLKVEIPKSPEFTFEREGPIFVTPEPLKFVLPEKKLRITEIVI